MLEVVARYHGLNKSATIVSLVRREFWRAFPGGTDQIRPDRGAKVEGQQMRYLLLVALLVSRQALWRRPSRSAS